MNMTIEALQQQILSSSGEIFNPSSNNSNSGGIGAYNNLSADALNQLFRSQDFIQHDTPSTTSTTLSSSSNQYQFGDLFHNSQVFKGFPEGLYTYLNTRGEETERGSLPPVPGFDNSKFMKWMNTLDSQHPSTDPKQRGSDQAIPLYPSADDHLAYVNSHSNVGIVPSITEVTNAQGTIILESSTNEQQVKKRMPEVHLIEGDKAVKKKRRQEKNREAAQLFRQRQKAKVHELEKAVDDLTCNNSEYRMKMEILAFENKILKDQLFYLKNLVSSGILITSMPNAPSFPGLDKPDTPPMMLGNSPAVATPRGASPIPAGNTIPLATASRGASIVSGSSTLPPLAAKITVPSPASSASNSRGMLPSSISPHSATIPLVGTVLPLHLSPATAAAPSTMSMNLSLHQQGNTTQSSPAVSNSTNNALHQISGAPNNAPRTSGTPSPKISANSTGASTPNINSTTTTTTTTTLPTKPEESRKLPTLPAS